MNKIATKIRMGAAVTTIAAAVSMVQAPVAQAVPATPPPTALGAMLGSTACTIGIFDPGQCATGAAVLPGLFYLGPVDPTPPRRLTFFTFNPTPFFVLIPIFGPAIATWWNSLDFEICDKGGSVRIGGYGNVGNMSVSIGLGC